MHLTYNPFPPRTAPRAGPIRQGIGLYLPRRHRTSAPAIGGRHPALHLLLSWVALLALLLGSGVGAAAVSGSALVAATHAVQAEFPGGGEAAPEEESPAKPHRQSSARTASTHACTRAALPAVSASWILLQSQTPPSRFAAVAQTISEPWPVLPGRRVQRGQAPPRA